MMKVLTGLEMLLFHANFSTTKEHRGNNGNVRLKFTMGESMSTSFWSEVSLRWKQESVPETPPTHKKRPVT